MVFATGEEMLLRKFFKFGVAKPLDVKTKFMNIEEDILLEVQIQNATPTHMFLDTVTFDPSAGFRAQDLNTIRTNKSAKKPTIQLNNVCFAVRRCQCLEKITFFLHGTSVNTCTN
ncbi:Trafficking protein particle complex subunit 13 [Geodia barretti]|nr:Trafficking protein particle complex subunit 13 [Geodia barretti]